MEPTPTYLGLNLAEVREFTRLERSEFETRRDRSRRIVEARWRRWTIVVLGLVLYVVLLGLLHLHGSTWIQIPLQGGLPILLAYEAFHSRLAKGERPSEVAIYRGPSQMPFLGYINVAARSAGLKPRKVGEPVEVTVLLPSSRLWSVDGFRVRRPVRLEPKAVVAPPAADEDGRNLILAEQEELRLWAVGRLDTAQRLGGTVAILLIFVGGFAWAVPDAWGLWIVLATGIAALAMSALGYARDARQALRALQDPHLRLVVASPDRRSPTVAMTVVEGTGLPWTIEGHPAPWRYGGEPRRVRNATPVRRDEQSL